MKKVSEIAKLAQTNRQKIYRLINVYHIKPVKTINKVNFYDEKIIIELLNHNKIVTSVTAMDSEKTTFVTNNDKNTVTVLQLALQQIDQLNEQIKIKDEQIDQLQKLLEQQQRLLDQQQQLELHEKKLVNKNKNTVTSVTATNSDKTTSATNNVTTINDSNNHKKWWHFW